MSISENANHKNIGRPAYFSYGYLGLERNHKLSRY